MANPTKVQINLKAKDPNILAVICTTYRRVESGMGPNKKIKYRKFASVTQAMVPQIFDIDHPGKGGLLSIVGIDQFTGVVYSSLRRMRK